MTLFFASQVQWEAPPGIGMLPKTWVTVTPSGMVMLLDHGLLDHVDRREGHNKVSSLVLGVVSTDVYIYKGALLPVELSRRHSQIVDCSST